LLLKVSTPAAEFDKKVGKDIMRESLQMIYEYMSTIVLGDDLDWIYGNFVFDQVKAFDKNSRLVFCKLERRFQRLRR